jgi:hypothetical protein
MNNEEDYVRHLNRGADGFSPRQLKLSPLVEVNLLSHTVAMSTSALTFGLRGEHAHSSNFIFLCPSFSYFLRFCIMLLYCHYILYFISFF